MVETDERQKRGHVDESDKTGVEIYSFHPAGTDYLRTAPNYTLLCKTDHTRAPT